MSKAQKGLMWFGDIARNLYQSILNEPSVSVVTASGKRTLDLVHQTHGVNDVPQIGNGDLPSFHTLAKMFVHS